MKHPALVINVSLSDDSCHHCEEAAHEPPEKHGLVWLGHCENCCRYGRVDRDVDACGYVTYWCDSCAQGQEG